MQQPEKTVPLKSLLIGGLVVVLAVVFLLWWQSDALREALCRPGDCGEAVAEAEPATVPAEPAEEAARPWPLAQTLTGVIERWTEVSGTAPEWPSDFSVPQSCRQVEADLAMLCSAVKIDGLCPAIEQAAEELAKNPPRPSSELRSYSTMLGNVFHLFRTLGKQRVTMLRDALQEEQATQELAAMTLYRWMLSRERCTEGRSAIDLKAMYEYSAFLLQTMGGQAYLRRRGPLTEALATFYALVILDQAIEANINPHGIDPRPELGRTRGLVESQPLVFRDRYLAILDEIQARWDARAVR